MKTCRNRFNGIKILFSLIMDNIVIRTVPPIIPPGRAAVNSGAKNRGSLPAGQCAVLRYAYIRCPWALPGKAARHLRMLFFGLDGGINPYRASGWHTILVKYRAKGKLLGRRGSVRLNQFYNAGGF